MGMTKTNFLLALMVMVIASPAFSSSTPWADETNTDGMTDVVMPAIASSTRDIWPLGNQLYVGIVCLGGRLRFAMGAEGLGVISSGALHYKARIDKGPVRSNFHVMDRGAAILYPAESRLFAAELMRGNSLLIRVTKIDGGYVDFVVSLKGFTAVYKSTLPDSCRNPA